MADLKPLARMFHNTECPARGPNAIGGPGVPNEKFVAN
jgi:hypothetical protein